MDGYDVENKDHDFLTQDKTVNKEYNLQVMCKLHKIILHKCVHLWKNKNLLSHHDNILAHTPLLVREFLTKNKTLIRPQPPYSPDLPPKTFFVLETEEVQERTTLRYD